MVSYVYVKRENVDIVIPQVPATCLSDREPPTQKGIEDRFKMLIGKRRKEVKKTAAASRIVEEHREKEMLLDDFILEMEDQIGQEKEKKGKRLGKEQNLKEAGDEVRDRALKRSNTCGGKSADHISPGAETPRRRIAYDSDEDTTEAFVRDTKHRRDQEYRRFKLEGTRFQLEQIRSEEEGKRFEAIRGTKRRKLALEERKIDVEIEERKLAIAEGSKMFQVLSALANKLK